MKKFLPILCAALLFAVALCAFAACGKTVAEVDVDRLYRRCDSHLEVAVATSTLVVIDTDVYSVYIEEIDYGSDITIDYAKNPNSTVSMTNDGGVSIKETYKETNARPENAFMIVGIPERIMERGSLTLIVTSDSGNLQFDDVTANSLTASTQSGTIRLDGCHATVGAEIQTVSGAVYADVEGDSISVTTQSGDVGFELSVKNITVSTASGSIKGKVDHPEYWYSIDARSDTGKCNLTSRQGGENCKLSVVSVSGNIKVRFEKD